MSAQHDAVRLKKGMLRLVEDGGDITQATTLVLSIAGTHHPEIAVQARDLLAGVEGTEARKAERIMTQILKLRIWTDRSG